MISFEYNIAFVDALFDDESNYNGKYWYAKLLRTDFMGKLRSFFKGVCGDRSYKLYNDKQWYSIGVADLLILPWLVAHFIYPIKLESTIAKFFKIAIIICFEFLPRFLLGLVLTAAFSPLIGLFNLGTYGISRTMRNEIIQTPGALVPSNRENCEVNESNKKINDILIEAHGDAWNNTCSIHKNNAGKLVISYKTNTVIPNVNKMIIENDPKIVHDMRVLNFANINKTIPDDAEDDACQKLH